MRAQLKSLHFPDIDLEKFWPEDESNFGFYLEAMIGLEGQDGADLFGMQVCTPDWLRSHKSSSEILFGRHLLIVFEFDKKRLEQKIAKYCDGTFGDNWQEIANKLSQIGLWEFEGYKKYKEDDQ